MISKSFRKNNSTYLPKYHTSDKELLKNAFLIEEHPLIIILYHRFLLVKLNYLLSWKEILLPHEKFLPQQYFNVTMVV